LLAVKYEFCATSHVQLWFTRLKTAQIKNCIIRNAVTV